MTILEGIILGVIQGLSEFLPISSSGHLVLFQKLFGLEEGALTFDIAVHLATLISVCFVFWKDLWGMVRRPLSKMTLLVVAGTVPTLVIAVLFNDIFEKLFQSGRTLGLEFILTGLILWFAESVRSRNKGIETTSYTDAAFVGVAQGIAILPAVSRSGLTLAGALTRGLNREFALKFSFLLSVPSILAAAAKEGYDMLKAGVPAAGVEIVPLVAGMLAAAISGYLAVRFMLKVFSKVSLKVFSYYVFALGLLVIVDQLFFQHFFGRLI